MKRVKYSSKSSKNNSQTGDNKKCNLLKSKRTLLKGNVTSLSSSTTKLLKWSRVIICYICMFFVDSFYYLSLVKSVTNNTNVCLYGFTNWNSKRGGKKENKIVMINVKRMSVSLSANWVLINVVVYNWCILTRSNIYWIRTFLIL